MTTHYKTLRDARVAAAARCAEGHRVRVMQQSRPGRTYKVQVIALRKTYLKIYYPYCSSEGRRFWLTVPNDC